MDIPEANICYLNKSCLSVCLFGLLKGRTEQIKVKIGEIGDDGGIQESLFHRINTMKSKTLGFGGPL